MSGIVASLPFAPGRTSFAIEQMRRMLGLLTDPYGNLETAELALRAGAVGYMQRPPSKSKIISHAEDDTAVAVVDGHAYDSGSGPSGASLAAEVLRLYRSEEGLPSLAGVDGLFAGLVYDSARSRVVVFSDQFGLRRLYYSVQDGVLYLSSEVKAFLALEHFAMSVSTLSVSSFFTHGVLAENKTWLSEVFLLPPATVLTWTHDSAPTATSFQIKVTPPSSTPRFDEACDEAGRLFQRAVDKRHKGMAKVGVRLSGGLDSRSIVAALTKSDVRCETFTFGRKGSLDGRIAKRVSKIAASRHHEYEFTERTWFNNRVASVWISDGHLDVQNMHGMPDILEYADLDVHLCGDLGGGIIGGLFLETWPVMPSVAVLNNRLRRFSGESSAYNFHFMDERCPFYDLELLRFLFALPAEFLRNSRLYRRMLLKQYPTFYRTVPWQHTGTPIWFHESIQYAVRLGLVGTSRTLARFVDPKIDVAFHLNKLWFRLDPARSIVEELLLSPDPLFSDYLDRELSQNRVREHLMGRKDHIEFLSKLLTFEIWLRSVRNRGQLAWT